jgi:hypothetical protein
VGFGKVVLGAVRGAVVKPMLTAAAAYLERLELDEHTKCPVCDHRLVM